MAQPQQFGSPAPLRTSLDKAGKVFFETEPWVRFWNYFTGKFWVPAPAAANAVGSAGQIAYDANFFYVCVSTNSWKRVAIAAW